MGRNTHLEDEEGDGRIVLRLILRKWIVRLVGLLIVSSS
jgi:hypothetical protein